MFELVLIIFFSPDSIIETGYAALLSDYFGIKSERCQPGSNGTRL